jgi:hypothetical protein
MLTNENLMERILKLGCEVNRLEEKIDRILYLLEPKTKKPTNPPRRK